MEQREDHENKREKKKKSKAREKGSTKKRKEKKGSLRRRLKSIVTLGSSTGNVPSTGSGIFQLAPDFPYLSRERDDQPDSTEAAGEAENQKQIPSGDSLPEEIWMAIFRFILKLKSEPRAAVDSDARL